MAKYISSIDLAGITSVDHSTIMQELSEQGILQTEDTFVLRLSESDVSTISDIFNEYHIQEINKFFGITKDVKLQFDLFGELAPAKTKKTKDKSVAPIRTWESPDYLPDLEMCRNYEYKLFTQEDFAEPMHEEIIFDIEIYNNYFLIMFLGYRTGKCFYFEKKNDEPLDNQWIKWFMDNHTLVSFNGIKFDVPLLQCALAGHDTQTLMTVCNTLIDDENGLRPYQVVKQYKGVKLEVDHIDLIEVAPLKGSLKLYGARLHTPNLQDLPFKVGIDLSDDQISIVRRYCLNDVQTTWFLYRELRPQIELRKDIGKQYGVDVRSKADAQIAETIIKVECESVLGRRVFSKNEDLTTSIQYNAPSFIKFNRTDLQELLVKIEKEKFHLENGYLQAGIMEDVEVNVANSVVRMSIGGAHSSEKSVSYYADDEYMVVDIDAGSFYPSIIITQGLVPEQLGSAFLKVYAPAKEKRIKAKREGNKVVDATYKIVLNSSFGKFGNKFSILYAPKLLLQTTLTGQLSLLMLAERFEEAGFLIIQLNTDGICIRLKRTEAEHLQSVVAQWELETKFNMEYVYYKSIHSRDVNNYFSIKDSGGIKRKGAYAEESLSKNPQNCVCTDAVANYLMTLESIDDYIRNSKDIRKFLSVRNVTGGAIKDMTYLGKTVRFYHSLSTETALQYAKSGNLVPNSERCRPLMRISSEFPVDLDYNYYVNEAYSILKDIGVKY